MRLGRLVTLVTLLLLVACSNSPVQDSVSQGRVLLWHTWTGADEEALNDLLDKFNDVYPEITVISISYSEPELQHQFIDVAQRGMGPDLIIGSQLWIPELVDAGLIHALEEDRIDLTPFLSTAIQSLRYRGDLYGLPLSVQTSALYYRKDQIQEPPGTLSALLEQAANGRKVALNTNFEEAFWGVQAFGGRLFDEEMRVVLNQGGLANWLSWLIEASNAPNIILGRDEETLRNLFREGEVSYYVGKSSDLLDFQEALGDKAVGVSPLPAGPNNLAGPFLTTEPFFFSTDSSPVQAQRAMLLAQFLTNSEQQRKLAQLTGRVPANAQARINRRISPAVAGFVEQSKTAIPLLLIPQTFEVIELGQDMYLQVLEGLEEPTAATYDLTRTVNDEYDLETLDTATEVTCGGTGNIEIWHSWRESDARVLEIIGHNYTSQCPGTRIQFTSFEPEALYPQYRRALQSGGGPHLLLISSEYTARLAAAELVSDLSDMVEPGFLQRYIPNVPEAMRVDGNLYGLPITMDTVALYYNGFLANEPPVDLSDLLSRIGPERKFALPYAPARIAHWGVSAFGGRLFDIEGNLAINEGGFEEWLQWLRASSDHPGMVLTKSEAEARSLFAQGGAIYFVGGRESLKELQEQLGETRVRVAPLPAGPEGSSGPILNVQGLMFNPEIERRDSALAFAKYVVGLESQSLLMKVGKLVPANVNARDPISAPAIAGFLDQASTAVVLGNHPESDVIFNLGDTIYENVVEQEADPAIVLADFDRFLRNMGDQGVPPLGCGHEDDLLLWHSLQGAEAAVLDQFIVDFARRCPTVQVRLATVPAKDLPSQLAVATLEERAPDLLLTTHDLIEPLSEARLVKPITSWLSDSTLVPYLPQATAAMRYDTALYGVPYAIDTVGLYYNTEFVGAPPQEIVDLFDTASITAPLALDISFENIVWGAVPLGGDPYAMGEKTERLQLDLNRASFVKWLGWLQSKQGQEGVVMDDDPERLQELFVTGKAAYLIASSASLPQIRSAFDGNDHGMTQIGVSLLPEGEEGSASPFLTVHGFLFTTASSETKTETALAFVEFVTSGENQARLVHSASRVPANVMALTYIEDPAISAFMEQAHTAVLRPSRPEMQVINEGGDNLIQNVLEGGQELSEAIAEYRSFLSETPEPLLLAYTGEDVLTCEGAGQLSLWHATLDPSEDIAADTGEQKDARTVLQRIIDSFQEYCPGITIAIEYLPTDELLPRLSTATAAGTAPDLFIVNRDVMPPLIDGGHIKPISGLVDRTFLDQFINKTVTALTYNDELFGLPQKVDVTVLYYNARLVDTPESTLDGLLAAASPGTQVAFDSSIEGSYWGIGAYGGKLFDAEGRLAKDQSGFADWLTWLQNAGEQAGVLLASDPHNLQQQFADGTTAYLVSGSKSLPALRAELGDDVRVTPLPKGPKGDPTPLLSVDAFAFGATSDEAQTELALKFAQYATSEHAQRSLVTDASLTPANRLVAETTGDQAIGVAVKQIEEKAVLLPIGIEQTLLASLDDVYRFVLIEGWDVADSLSTLEEIADQP